jgi:antirestriction protein ArdC
MRYPKCIELDGKFVPWRELVKRRKEQVAKAAKAEQPALFEMKEDRRPAIARTAAGRYREPSLFSGLNDDKSGMSAPTPRNDIYARVTGKIIADLEKGVRTWLKPWNAEHAAGRITRPLRANGKPYQGVNVLMLWSDAVAKGFACPIWTTYRQAAELGGQVRKGEHGSLVVYADRITRTETDDKGEDVERHIPFMKGYTVFNCEQVDDLPAHFYAKAAAPLPAAERIASAEEFARATGAEIRHGGSRAFYATSSDHVQLPPFESFKDAESQES